MGGKTRNHLKRWSRSLGGVRNWQLILILIPLLFVTATLLRLDHIKMSKLRDAVIAADANDDDEALQARLVELEKFVFSHVIFNVVESNGVQSVVFGTGPFYLEHQYNRAATAAIERAEAELTDTSQPNGDIYSAVLNICRPLAIQNGWTLQGNEYMRCWSEELAKYPASDELVSEFTVKLPSTELYRKNYASPLWAPTWAGFAMLASAIIIVIVLIRIIIWLILQIALAFLKENP